MGVSDFRTAPCSSDLSFVVLEYFSYRYNVRQPGLVLPLVPGRRRRAKLSIHSANNWLTSFINVSDCYISKTGLTSFQLTADNVVMQQSYPPHISKVIESELEKLKVKILRSSRVAGTAMASNGQIEVTLESGEKLTTDLFLPTFGLAPNSEFLPRILLNAKGQIMVDECFRVKGATAMYAVGDVADIQRSAYIFTIPQAEHLAKNMDLVLKGKEPLIYKSPKGKGDVPNCLNNHC